MSEYKKTKSRKGKKRNNIVPFKKDLKVVSTNDNPIDAKQVETDKLNGHVKELFNDLGKFTEGCKLNSSEMWYNILFYAKQKALTSIPYFDYKVADKGSSDEVAENFVNFHKEHCSELFAKKEDDRTLNQEET